MRMDKIRALYLCDPGGVLQEVAAATGNFDEFDAQGSKLLVLVPANRLGYDSRHREAEFASADRGTERRVAHRGHHKSTRSAFPAQMLEQVDGTANLEASRRGDELTFGKHLSRGEEIAEPDQRGR